MLELVLFLVGLVLTVVVSLFFVYFSPAWEPFKERLASLVSRCLRRAEPHLKAGDYQLTGVREAQLKPMTVGSMILPIRRLVGGDGKTLYVHPEGVVSTWNPGKLTLPDDVLEVYSKLVEKRRSAAAARGAVFENRDHIRLDDYSFGLDGLHDVPWPLKLFLSQTDYHTIQATNYGIDEILPGGKTMRQKYAADPGDLRTSILGNPIATNMSVVTSDRKVYVAVRGSKTASTPSGFAPAVSGTGNPHLDRDGNGNYSPFLTAQRETCEEITGTPPSLDEIRFFGLARTLRYQLPFLFGEVRLATTTSEQLESAVPRDAWEAEKIVALPLEPDAIVRFVRDVYKETDENNIVNSATYAALFSLLQSLLYEYPDEWTAVVQQLTNLQKRQAAV
jgi:hypothetical protein